MNTHSFIKVACNVTDNVINTYNALSEKLAHISCLKHITKDNPIKLVCELESIYSKQMMLIKPIVTYLLESGFCRKKLIHKKRSFMGQIISYTFSVLTFGM